MVYQSYANDDRANQLSLLKIASPILLTLLVIDEHDHTFVVLHLFPSPLKKLTNGIHVHVMSINTRLNQPKPKRQILQLPGPMEFDIFYDRNVSLTLESPWLDVLFLSQMYQRNH